MWRSPAGSPSGRFLVGCLRRCQGAHDIKRGANSRGLDVLDAARGGRGATSCRLKMPESAWTIALPIRQPRARVFDPSTGARAHKIVRTDLAAWMVGGLDDGAFAHQTATLRPTAKPDSVGRVGVLVVVVVSASASARAMCRSGSGAAAQGGRLGDGVAGSPRTRAGVSMPPMQPKFLVRARVNTGRGLVMRRSGVRSPKAARSDYRMMMTSLACRMTAGVAPGRGTPLRWELIAVAVCPSRLRVGFLLRVVLRCPDATPRQAAGELPHWCTAFQHGVESAVWLMMRFLSRCGSTCPS